MPGRKLSERLYALLLQLYPRAFRERYAPEMARVLRDRLRDEPAARVWIDVLADAAVSIPLQHMEPVPNAMYPPSASPMRLSAAPRMFSLFGGAVIGSAAIAGIVAGALARRVPDAWPVLLMSVLSVMFVPGVMGVLAARRGLRVCRAIRSVWADVTEESVTVGYEGAPALTLQRRDVTGVHDFELIGLRIQTADPDRDLWVPAPTEAYADARVRLAHWVPMTVTPFFKPTRHFIPPGWARAVGILSVLLVTGMGLLVAFPLPMKGFIAGCLMLSAVGGLINREQPAWERLLPFGALTLLLFKWLW